MLVQDHPPAPLHPSPPDSPVDAPPDASPQQSFHIDFHSGYFRSQLLKKDPGRLNKKGAFAQFVSQNLSKIVIALLLLLGISILFLAKHRGDSSALLCVEPASRGSANASPYPDVDFRTVDSLQDESKFRVVKASKWIIVATSSQPTEQIQAMAKLQGWQVLVVGDSETPADWNVRGAIFLSLEQQATLGFRILAHLPYSSYVRKSVAYLFAIQHGAKVIYDLDEHSSILQTDLSKAFDLELSESRKQTQTIPQYLPLQNRTVVNPYIHFGQRSVWPRGLPLEVIGNINAEMYYTHITSGNQFIQQGLINGFPDVDSIFYNTRKAVSESFDISFDAHALAVAVPKGTMAPVNHFNTLFHSPAFWALMLPVSANPKVSDVLRGYWAQRLLWEIGGYVAYYPPSTHRGDTEKSYPFEDEQDLHENAGRLTDFLVKWNSEKASFFERVLDLSHAMADAGFWTVLDVAFTADWLQDLISVGYTQPTLSEVKTDSQSSVFEFIPLSLPSIHLGVEDKSTVGFEIGNLLRWKAFYGNIVLIMECTWPVDHTALAWRMLYGRIFKNVVLLSSKDDARFGVLATEDWQSYKALPDIFGRFRNADGFLYLKEHAILNYWNLLQANNTKLWSLHQVVNAWNIISHNENGTEWYHKSSIKRTVKKMVKNLPVHFRVTYRENIDDGHFVVSKSDVFYVPQRFVRDFVELVALGIQAKLHQELAIPLFLMSMDHIENYEMEAFNSIVYETGFNASYTAEAQLVSPLQLRDEQDLLHIMKHMAAGDPLLLEVL